MLHTFDWQFDFLLEIEWKVSKTNRTTIADLSINKARIFFHSTYKLLCADLLGCCVLILLPVHTSRSLFIFSLFIRASNDLFDRYGCLRKHPGIRNCKDFENHFPEFVLRFFLVVMVQSLSKLLHVDFTTFVLIFSSLIACQPSWAIIFSFAYLHNLHLNPNARTNF